MSGKIDRRKKGNIVIVDDEEFILKELRILLGRAYKVDIFTNPEDAEVFVDQNDVDLIISDEMMPEMRGSVLLSRIHKKHPDICNIVLSGQAEKDDIVRAVNEGHIFSFLYKPAESQQLLNVIEKGLENRNMKMQLAKQNVQLKEYSENLEKMVEEKTAQLVKAYDRLNVLDENKMFFLVYLSQEIDSSLDRIQKLAEALLNYFALAGTELKLGRKQESLKSLVDEVLQPLQSNFQSAGIQLDVSVDPDLTVNADADYLKKVLCTIVENALVFTPEGGEVTLSGTSVNGKTQFCAADTGKGIEDENLKSVFKPFVLDHASRNPDGFGLNLPMARTIMIAHEGEIWAESDGPGRGSRFCIEIPSS